MNRNFAEIFSGFEFNENSREEMSASPDIYASLERLVAAVNTKDLDGIMKYYVPDNVPGETLVVFDGIPPRQYVGAAAFRQDWANFLAK
jgi:ketosteroid isomerase-like protein